MTGGDATVVAHQYGVGHRAQQQRQDGTDQRSYADIEKVRAALKELKGQLLGFWASNDEQLMPWKAGDFWAIENKATRLAWNNSHGDSADGNPVISWTNNSDNAAKPTRQWYVEQADETISAAIAAHRDDDLDYRILYDPHTNQIRLQFANGRQPTVNGQWSTVNDIVLYDLNGQRVASPHEGTGGEHIYILRWTVNGRTYSRKIKLG